MSYDARVFNVMIASPSDVASEREIVREVIYDWNAVHSERENIVLLPVGWESHSSPEMGARPQEIINRQTLDGCDLLVGIFGTRIGTDTGEYESGTIEEIERHNALGKPAMLYFSKRLGDSDTFDSDQYAKLEELKKDYERRGLYEVYDDDVDFKDKFYRQLEIKVNGHKIFQFQREGINSGLEMEELESNIPQLSDEAKVLLKTASQDSYGYIVYETSANGTAIQSGDNEFSDTNIIPDQSPRVLARWRAALKELKEADLLENNGRYFQITDHGYTVADTIEETT